MSARRRIVKGLAQRLRTLVYFMEGAASEVNPIGGVAGFAVYERTRPGEIASKLFVSPTTFIKVFKQWADMIEFTRYRKTLNPILTNADFLIKVVNKDVAGNIMVPKWLDETQARRSDETGVVLPGSTVIPPDKGITPGTELLT